MKKISLFFILLLVSFPVYAQKFQPGVTVNVIGGAYPQDSLDQRVQYADSSSVDGAEFRYVTPSMLHHISTLVSLTGTTGLSLTGTGVTKGINFAGATPAFNADNAFLSLGTWNVPYVVSSQTAHFAPIQVSLQSNTSVAADITAARLRVNTGAANTLTAVNVLEMRSSLGHNVGSHANLQASTSISTSITSTGDLLVGYFSLQGSGTITSSNHVNVLEATNVSTCVGVKNVSHFTNNGGTVTNILKLEGLNSATATNGLNITNTSGTITNGISLSGVFSKDIVLQNGETIDNATDGTIDFGNANLSMTGNISSGNIDNVMRDTTAWNLKGTDYTAYAAGTVYTITATNALLDFGTTDPSITLVTAGTYLITARVTADYEGATFAAVDSISFNLRRTNNTAADVANSTTLIKVPILTTATYTATTMNLPSIIYTTANTNDVIQLWGKVLALPSAGDVKVREASIIAIKLY